MIQDEVEINGVRVNVAVWGHDAEPIATIVGIHGFGPAGFTSFERVGSKFAGESVRLVAPDLPGFGGSERLNRYSLRLYSDIVHGITARYAAPVTVVLGHSFGAKVVLAAICDAPELFSGFVLVNPGGFSGPTEHLIKLGDVPIVKDFLSQPWFYKVVALAGIRHPVSNEEFRAAARELSGSYRELDLGTTEYSTQIQAISQPGQLIWGGADPILSTSVIDRVRKIFPDIHYTEIREAGHAPMRSKPDQFTNSTMQFLKSLGLSY
ncbi:MAG: alpha/beta hydrolase [Rhodothermales bacterium]|nr:alpha/beta hydrolase [Rhodothermales bacterium]